MKSLLCATLLIVFTNSLLSQFGAESNLVTVEVYTSAEKVHPGGEFKFAIKAKISDGWHINSNKPNEDFLIPSTVELVSEKDFKITMTKFPEPKEVTLGFSEIPVSVFEGETLIGGVINVPANIELGEYQIQIKFNYQACNDVTCMPPYSAEQNLSINIVDERVSIEEQNSELFSEINLGSSNQTNNKEGILGDTLESSGLIISLMIVFLGGLALNLTPCVYPLIPITIGYFGGQSEGRTSRLFLLGVLYVFGLALTYSVVGVVTALSGAVFGSLLQSPIVIIGIALVLIALAMSMFGVYEFKLPDAMVAKAGGAKAGSFGAFFMGLTMGIVAAPCIGPFVIGLITYIAAKGDPLYGFLMFFFMAVGLGLPYLFLALFSGKIKALPKAGFWMEAIKHIFGFILVGMAIYFITPLFSENLARNILPIYMILAVLFLLFVDKLANDILGFRIFKIVFSLIMLGLAVYMLWPIQKDSPDWRIFNDQVYEQALADNQKMIIDFYADWCIPCKELDAQTFSDPRVVELSKGFICFKIDMTQTMSDETDRIRNKFNIVGMPTVIIMDSNGIEVNRITGFLDANEFLTVLSAVK